MRARTVAARAALAFGVVASVAVFACGRDEGRPGGSAPSDAPLATSLPEAIGPFRAVSATRPGVAELSGRRLVSAERTYDARGREATLRIVDVTSEPRLVSSFALARDLEVDELDALTRPIRIAHEPAIVQWTRDTAESEVQVLVDDRYLVTLKVWPADRRDEAADLFPADVVAKLGGAR